MGLLGLLSSNTRAPDCRPASMKRSGTSAKSSSCSGTEITSAAHRCPHRHKALVRRRRNEQALLL